MCVEIPAQQHDLKEQHGCRPYCRCATDVWQHHFGEQWLNEEQQACGQKYGRHEDGRQHQMTAIRAGQRATGVCVQVVHAIVLLLESHMLGTLILAE
jgi:hypothetical protein